MDNMLRNDYIELIKSWFYEAASIIKKRLSEELMVEEKSGRTDLVTNIDKEIEHFFMKKIRSSFPTDKIMGEEGLGDTVTSLDGRVWIIDPIDGTLNLVKQHDNFCIMLAFLEDSIGQLGFIYNVMQDEFIYGGKEIGVFCNDIRLSPVVNRSLADGLIGISARMYTQNDFNVQTIGSKSSGIRICGCAGIEFMKLLKGNQVAYFAYLAPWDYAAGVILGLELGLVAADFNGKPLDFLTKTPMICATPKVMHAVL